MEKVGAMPWDSHLEVKAAAGLVGLRLVGLSSDADLGQPMREEAMPASSTRSINNNCRDTADLVGLETEVLAILHLGQASRDPRLDGHGRIDDGRLDRHGYG